MQDADYSPGSQPEILTDFALSLDPQRFTAPQLAVTSAVAGRIAAGLAARAKGAGLHPKHAARRLRMRRKVLIETVADLFDTGALAECAHLSAACGALNAPRVAIYWARALENLRAHDDLRTLIDRLEADPDLIARNRRNLLDLRMHNMMGLKAADHRVFVPGQIPATLGAALARLPAPDVQWVAPKLADTLARIRGLTGAEAEAFKAKLSWGRAAADYLTFLKYYAAPGSGGPQPGTGPDQGGPGDPEVRELLGQLKALMILPDPNPMVAAAQAGRSIVLTAAHAGLPVVAPWIMTEPGLPLLGISAKSPTDLDNPVDKTLGVHGNFQADFLRAVKLLRRDPHLVQLLPDGGLGGATTQHRFHGVDLPLGQGAAVMAWQARAAVFFFGTRWRDGRLEIYVRPGPVAEKTGDRAVFDTAFYDFYLGCLDDILYGPPEDMAPGGGFWRHLKAEAEGGV